MNSGQCTCAMLLLWDNSKHVQLLKSSKLEINFGWSHPDKSIFWLFASTSDIRKLGKCYLCSQIASRHLSLVSANTLTCCHLETLFSLPQRIKLIICQLLHLFLCKFFLKCLLWFFLYPTVPIGKKTFPLLARCCCWYAVCMLWIYKLKHIK